MSSDSDQDYEYEWKAFMVVKTDENGKERYDCIPSTWLVCDDEEEEGHGHHTIVTFQFPSTSKLGKGIIFKKNQPPNKNWPDFNGTMLLNTDSQTKAFRFIEKEKAKRNKKMKDYSSSSSSTIKSDSEEENQPKQSGAKRKQSELESENIQPKSKKLAEESDKTINLEKIELAKQLHSHCNNIYEEFNTSYQKSMSILNNSAGNLKTIISTYKAKLSLPTTQVYDDLLLDDTKWTLRNPKPEQGLTELMPNTGVYVSEQGLSECKIKYITYTTFTKGVLKLVFTDDAMKLCSFTGQPPKRQEVDNLPTRPGLDLLARETLVSYVTEYCSNKGWLKDKIPYKAVADCVRSKLGEAYLKSKNLPKRK